MLEHHLQANPIVGQKAEKLRLDLTNRGPGNAISEKKTLSLQRKTARHSADRKCQKSNIKITVEPAAAPRFHLHGAAIVNFDMSL